MRIYFLVVGFSAVWLVNIPLSSSFEYFIEPLAYGWIEYLYNGVAGVKREDEIHSVSDQRFFYMCISFPEMRLFMLYGSGNLEAGFYSFAVAVRLSNYTTFCWSRDSRKWSREWYFVFL